MSIPWSERFNSPSPTIDTLTCSEVTAPHGTVATAHTILSTQSVPQELMEEASQVLLSPAGTSCGSGPDAQAIPSIISPTTSVLQSSLFGPGSNGLKPEQGLRKDPSAVHRLTKAAPEGSDPESQSTGWDYHKLVSVVLALSGSIAAQAGIHHEAGPRTPCPLEQMSVLPRYPCLFSVLLVGIGFLESIGRQHWTDPVTNLPNRLNRSGIFIIPI